jgi:hypothetical protein
MIDLFVSSVFFGAQAAFGRRRRFALAVFCFAMFRIRHQPQNRVCGAPVGGRKGSCANNNKDGHINTHNT